MAFDTLEMVTDAQHVQKTATAANTVGVVDPGWATAAGKTVAIGDEIKLWLKVPKRLRGASAARSSNVSARRFHFQGETPMLSKRVEAVLREAAGRIDFLSPDLSFRRLREAAERIADLHETNSVTTFGWLLRSAVQEFANDIYQNIAVIYPNFVTEIRSNRRSEIYGGLYRGEMPRLTDAGEKFQDSTFKGFERELINYKFGRLGILRARTV